MTPNAKTLDRAKTVFQAVKLLQHRTMAHIASTITEYEGCCCPLTPPQMNAVRQVQERGEVTLKQLAQDLQVSAPSASTMVDRLVEGGFLRREQSKVDRREILISVTSEAKQHIDVVEEAIFSAMSEVLECLGEEDADHLNRIYGRVIELFETGELGL